ncbi:MAG TPA: hypothetical protein VK530_17800 [Candidatus Acidoferrum sp.]|nr:hypothetical protein [Candidatus Acidoferrum sp.]
MAAFAKTNLSIGDAELTEIQEALENLGQRDAVENAVVARDRYVRDQTARYIVPEDTLMRLWSAYVLFDLYTLLTGEMPANRKIAYDEAVKEMREIRDGDSTYPLAEAQPERDTQGGADWGGCKEI